MKMLMKCDKVVFTELPSNLEYGVKDGINIKYCDTLTDDIFEDIANHRYQMVATDGKSMIVPLKEGLHYSQCLLTLLLYRLLVNHTDDITNATIEYDMNTDYISPTWNPLFYHKVSDKEGSHKYYIYKKLLSRLLPDDWDDLFTHVIKFFPNDDSANVFKDTYIYRLLTDVNSLLYRDDVQYSFLLSECRYVVDNGNLRWKYCKKTNTYYSEYYENIVLNQANNEYEYYLMKSRFDIGDDLVYAEDADGYYPRETLVYLYETDAYVHDIDKYYANRGYMLGYHGKTYDGKYIDNRGSVIQMGMEFEFEFQNTNIHELKKSLFHQSNRWSEFCLTRDGSLTDGYAFEMVTKPFVDINELDLKNILKEIEQYNPKFKHCGHHVHIDARSFKSDRHITAFIYLFNNLKDDMYKLSKRTSKRQVERYSRFIQATTPIIYKYVSNGSAVYCDRYVTTNFTGKTLEVRLFKGTAKYKHVIDRITVLQKMVTLVNTLSLDDAMDMIKLNQITYDDILKVQL